MKVSFLCCCSILLLIQDVHSFCHSSNVRKSFFGNKSNRKSFPNLYSRGNISDEDAEKSEEKQKAQPSSSKKKRKKSPTIKWIACTSTKEVNRAINMYIREGDTVAELGSQLRETSTTICEAIGQSGKAYLVDIERKYPKTKLKRQERMTAMRREGDENDFYTDRADFKDIKSFDSWRHSLFFRRDQMKLKIENEKHDYGQYNALVVDVSTIAGNDLELTCVSLIREFIALNDSNDDDDDGDNNNPCRVVIIKSGSLHQLARRLFHAQRLFADVVSLEDNPHRTSIIGTVGVEEYRRTIPYTVEKGDAVLEVGSHFGTTTTILHDAARDVEDDDTDEIKGHDDLSCGGCLGVDVGLPIIESAKKKFPNVPFVVGDAWKMSELIQMKEDFFVGHTTSNKLQYDVVYVDVGGLSGSEGLLEALSLLGSISNTLEPRCIVIKSLCIRRLASSLVPFSQVWKQHKLRQ